MKRKLVATIFVLLVCTAAIAEPVTPDRVRVGPELMSTRVATKVAPIYPAEAKQEHVQGTVTLRVEISKVGDVEDVKLISGHPMLAPAAIKAVKQWKYKPYLLDAEAVRVVTTVTVNFTLADETQTGTPAGTADPGNAGGPAVPRRARVSQSVAQGLLTHKVQPENPGDAARIRGTVLLSATIDKEGNVANLRLISGHPMLAPAAIEAVRQWKYRPYLLNGEPVEIETTVAVNVDY